MNEEVVLFLVVQEKSPMAANSKAKEVSEREGGTSTD
jgi:hypothetical protein